MAKKVPKTKDDLLEQANQQNTLIENKYKGSIKLRKWLEECHLNNKNMAILLDITRFEIQHYLRGTRKPSKSMMEKIYNLTKGMVASPEDLVDD